MVSKFLPALLLVLNVAADLPGHPGHSSHSSHSSHPRRSQKARRGRQEFQNPFMREGVDIPVDIPTSNDFISSGGPEVVSVDFQEEFRNDGGFPTRADGGIDFSQATRNADGKLCVKKDTVVQTLQKEPLLTCTHQNVEKCHYTYVTFFKSATEEVCEENFEKTCQITFKQQATKETVKKCYRPLIKVCNGQGPEECRTLYESSCTTRYVKKANGRFVGDTSCEKLPVEICGAGCVTEQGPEECHDKETAALVDVPEEICDLNPQKTCRFATKLVPSLKPTHECTVVPKETCNLQFSSPKLIDKPLKEEWCLDETPAAPGETYDEASALGNPIGV